MNTFSIIYKFDKNFIEIHLNILNYFNIFQYISLYLYIIN